MRSAEPHVLPASTEVLAGSVTTYDTGRGAGGDVFLSYCRLYTLMVSGARAIYLAVSYYP